MSDIPSNGHSDNGHSEEPFIPRIVPPEGQRAARGYYSPESNEDTPGFNDESNPDATNITVAEVPSVEDSYLPPMETSPEPEPPSLNGSKNPHTPKDVELGLMEHLGELRQRLLYCFLILAFGMTVTWNYALPLQEWFAQPIRDVIKGKGILQSTDPTGFFSITVQFSLVTAIILTAPLLFWQVWRFIEPALTQTERRYSLVIVPFSSVLFFMGAGLGYAVSPLFYKFFLAFQPEGIAANWDYYQSIILMAKMLLVFGVTFQVPVVVIFLNKLGLLSRNVLIEYWRHAVVVIFVVVAVLTPTWDPVTLMVCAGPPCVLYALSIWLVKWL
jgi:sec-independent protein translocase protein TatC